MGEEEWRVIPLMLVRSPWCTFSTIPGILSACNVNCTVPYYIKMIPLFQDGLPSDRASSHAVPSSQVRTPFPFPFPAS